MRYCKDCKWLVGQECRNPSFADPVSGEPCNWDARDQRYKDAACGHDAIGFEPIEIEDRIDSVCRIVASLEFIAKGMESKTRSCEQRLHIIESKVLKK